MEEILKIEGLSKRFNETLALNQVDFSLRRGEIHGLVGANGSGKSTLMNILSGSSNISATGGYQGRIYIGGREAKILNYKESRAYGIGMVHQELSLFPKLSIAENIKINREHSRSFGRSLGNFALVDKAGNERDADQALSKLGLDLEVRQELEGLSSNLRQFVEIAREIDDHKLKVLMLDEPTSSMNVEETRLLLEHLKSLAEAGISIIFVSHRLDEVQAICDRVTVLRDGELIRTYESQEIDLERIALDMIGTELVETLRGDRDQSEEDLLSFKEASSWVGEREFKLSLDIKKGEILGITGLAGHGQEAFGHGLMGLSPMEGQVLFKGQRIRPGDSERIYRAGIMLLPDDRKEMGLLLDRPIWENILGNGMGSRKEFLSIPALGSLSFLNYKRIFSHSEEMLENLNIKASSIHQKVGELSGGNQQKVCIARAITARPELLFVGEPTRGIDIFSKELILKMLLAMNKEEGTTILISSGEIGELKRICDRIVIMYENEIFEIFDKDFDSEEFDLAISGRRKE